MPSTLKQKTRTNGFQFPWSQNQVLCLVLEVLRIGGFTIFVARYLCLQKCLGILIPHTLLVVLLLVAWLLCESQNPAKSVSRLLSWPIFKVPDKAARYCMTCNKTCPGLDHHCSWLNTCIAASNYQPFYFLVCIAMLQSILQLVAGTYIAAGIFQREISSQIPEDWRTGTQILLWTHNILCLVIAGAFAILSAFHTYLIHIGLGTYDYILESRQADLCAVKRVVYRWLAEKTCGRKAATASKVKQINSKMAVGPAIRTILESRNEIDGQIELSVSACVTATDDTK